MNTDNSIHEYYIRLKESESRMNTHEARVSLETAKMLQKAGFDWECEYAILPGTEMGNTPYRYNKGKSHNYNNKEAYPFEIYSAPSLDVAQRWLREVKRIFITVSVYAVIEQGHEITDSDKFSVYAETWDSQSEFWNKWTSLFEIDDFNTYEEAQEAGIQKCLTLLLEGKK
jgi:hypothetical protein